MPRNQRIALSTGGEGTPTAANTRLTQAQPTIYFPYQGLSDETLSADATVAPGITDDLRTAKSCAWADKYKWLIHLETTTSGSATQWASGETVQITGYRPDGYPVLLAAAASTPGELAADGPYIYFKFVLTGGAAGTSIKTSIIGWKEGDSQ